MTRHTSASALNLITAPSQQGVVDEPWTVEASGLLSRWRLRVRALRWEGVSGSKEEGESLMVSLRGEGVGLVGG